MVIDGFIYPSILPSIHHLSQLSVDACKPSSCGSAGVSWGHSCSSICLGTSQGWNVQDGTTLIGGLDPGYHQGASIVLQVASHHHSLSQASLHGGWLPCGWRQKLSNLAGLFRIKPTRDTVSPPLPSVGWSKRWSQSRFRQKGNRPQLCWEAWPTLGTI